MLTEYIGNVNPVESGQVFVIGGKTIDAATRLDLNLLSGKSAEDSTILQLSVRFRQNIVVRNTCQLGEWGEEECSEHLINGKVTNPLVAGEKFKIYILIGDEKFHIALNNQTYCTYAHRMPVQEIRTIQLAYDLQVVTQIDHRTIYPSAIPPVQYEEVSMAFSSDVPMLFTPGHVVVVTGIPYGNPKGWFHLRFTEGVLKKQALHISVRFEYTEVVRNSMNDSLAFLEEERSGGFPFSFNQQFKLAICLTDRDFRLAVNGKQHSTFQYRSFNQLDKLNGFRMGVSYGMHLEITSVDHVRLGAGDYDGFALYSSPNATIY